MLLKKLLKYTVMRETCDTMKEGVYCSALLNSNDLILFDRILRIWLKMMDNTTPLEYIYSKNICVIYVQVSVCEYRYARVV